MSVLSDFFKPSNSKQLNKLTKQATKPIDPYAGETIADFDPLQTQGQGQLLQTRPQKGQLAQQGFDTNQFLLGDVLFPGTNPALQQTIDYAVQPITENLLHNALPAIRAGAEGAGQFGGSKKQIAEGLAVQGAERAVGGTAANIANENYLQGLKALMFGLGSVPGTQSFLESPALTTSGVGDVRQALEQNRLTADATQYYQDQMLPILNAQRTLQATPVQSSPFEQVAGVAGTVLPFFI